MSAMSDFGDANYMEPFRPQFHFTPRKGWTNDPNGLLFHDGIWELFYQFHPDIGGGGTYKHWGHARSTDLFHWESLPVAISPFTNSAGKDVSIFSGSAIVDDKNVTKLKSPGAPATILAFYTAHEVTDFYETQAMAYSTDNGITWTQYEGNPVIDNPEKLRDFRDPKVLRYNDKYIAVIAAGDHVRFFESKDLIRWEFMSTFRSRFSSTDTVWECSDLFKLEDDWILLVNHDARTEYFIGDFDGHTFSSEGPTEEIDRRYLDFGTNSYAGVTYEAAPDGRRVFLSWLPGFRPYAEKTPSSPWRGSMSVPRELSLVRLENGHPLIASQPVKEISVLYKEPTLRFEVSNVKSNAAFIVPNITSDLLDVYFSAEGVPRGGRLGIEFAGITDRVKVYYEAGHYHIDREDTEHDFDATFELAMSAPRLSATANLNLRIVLDVSSVEVFADGGLSVVTAQFFSRQKLSEMKVFFETSGPGEKLDIVRVTAHQLQSAWHEGSACDSASGGHDSEHRC